MPTLIINKNQANTIIPTLTENSTLDPVSYVFRLKGDSSNDYDYFTATELSTELQRYNKFTVTDTANPDMMDGEVNLVVGGYTYEAYEIDPADLVGVTDLSTLDFDTLDMVETGVLQCKETATANTEYSGAATTNTQYAG